jgi:uncharacterized protein
MAIHDDDVRIRIDGTHLDATLVSPSARMPGVLFVHGWGGSQAQYLARAKELAALGCVCLTFDLRGHARSETLRAQVSREENLADVVAAFDYLGEHIGVDPNAIAVIGSSYGGYLAALLTHLRPVRWLALRAPALYEDQGWGTPKLQLHKDQDLPAYRKRVIKPADNRALQACAAFTGDVLVVESEHDNIIPHTVISSYVEACAQARSLTYRVMASVDHGLSAPGGQRDYTMLLVKWLKEVAFAVRVESRTPSDVARIPETAPQELRATPRETG